ncbi:MAG: hypothetical protein CMJ18_01265 [Phycisphaeraceae bacterium]|nr:hypothetical protein [Phycisphaeraceae bacterium]
MAALDEAEADAVCGPVEALVPESTPAWIRRGRFHCRAATEGRPLGFRGFHTGNLLIRGAWFYERGLRFDPAYGRSGGCDMELFWQLRGAGAKCLPAPAARLWEHVEPERVCLRWLDEQTPAPSMTPTTKVGSWRDATIDYPEDTYGVLCGWDFGNFVSAIGRRIPVWSQWPTPRTAAWFVSESEEESLALLCPDCDARERVRYVIVDAQSAGPFFIAKAALVGHDASRYTTMAKHAAQQGRRLEHWTFGKRWAQSMAYRLYHDDGRDLGHYRLVYECPQESYSSYLAGPGTVTRITLPIVNAAHRRESVRRIAQGGYRFEPQGYEYDGRIDSSVRVYECVAGARIEGTAPAGARIDARLTLRARSTDRTFEYLRSGVVGRQGRFSLVVSHATGDAGPGCDVEAVGDYRIVIREADRDERKLGSVTVSIDQVREGAVIDSGN